MISRWYSHDLGPRRFCVFRDIASLVTGHIKSYREGIASKSDWRTYRSRRDRKSGNHKGQSIHRQSFLHLEATGDTISNEDTGRKKPQYNLMMPLKGNKHIHRIISMPTITMPTNVTIILMTVTMVTSNTPICGTRAVSTNKKLICMITYMAPIRLGSTMAPGI